MRHPDHAVTDRPLPLPDDSGRLLAFLPLIYVAWSDGSLSQSEVDRICARLDEAEALDDEARRVLESWLRPEAPPDATQLTRIRERIRRDARSIPESERRSLVSLGVAMARADGGDGAARWGSAEGLRTLEALEELLGILGSEAARDILPDETLPPEEAGEAEMGEPPALSVVELARLLDGPFAPRRERVHQLLREGELPIPRGLPASEYRERVLEAVQHLAGAGLGRMALPERYGGEGDVAGSMATFEALAYGDLSVVVKFGVQFGLFGGSILHLGTERHHRRWLEAAADLELPGCYAMTERDHGSNVRELQTRARYVPEAEEFEIHTPHEGAVKDWIGNAALHGRMATVFAQLETGGEEHGVHAFLVPIRDEEGRPLPGIRIEDCGDKAGLQGVDNGRIAFDRIRIPRENLLNRFGDVTPEGAYESPIASDGKRFFTMLGTLVTGRISIAAASVSASKTALAIAVPYSDRRRQFGPAGRPEVPILDYLTQQRALIPRIASSYALHFAVRELMVAYGEAESTEDRSRVEVMAAGLKAYASRHAQETIQVCREACGGQGYLADNRFGELRNDTDVFTTFEGANVVLLQLVARGLLSRFREEMGDLRFWGLLRFLAERASSEASRRNPIRSRRTGEDHLRDPEVQLDAFRFREQRLLDTVARRLKGRIDDGMDSFQAMNECQDHLVALARAYVERRVLQSFRRAADPDAAPEALRVLCDLWALERLEADRAWFLESGYMEGSRTRAIRALVNRLLGELRGCAVELVEAFGIPEDILAAPAARGGPPEEPAPVS
jgi:acyl-CoA oxidase